MKKKILSLMISAVLAAGLLSACGGNAASSNAASSASKEESADSSSEAPAEGDLSVAMVTDYGDITDQSFNQTTYEACKAYCEANGLTFNYFKPTTDSDADRVGAIEQAITEGYNVIVMPGYAFANAIYEVAPTYTDVKFVALDVSEGDLTAYGEREFSADNVFSAVYQEELPGYMAGYAAVKMGYKKLGFLGGMAVPAVIRYGFGFVQGADAAASELGLSDVEIKYAYGNQFYGDADITAAMDTWYQNGTEVVFACGGGIFTSAAEAAAKVDGKVIGVDVDQAPIIDGDYGEGMTITSAMKGLAATVNTLLDAINKGQWSEYAGKIETLGIISDNSDENYVALPASTQFGDGFTEDDYNKLVADMHSGAVTVSDSIDAMPEVSAVSVDDQGNIK